MVLKGHFKNYALTEYIFYVTISAMVGTVILTIGNVCFGAIYCRHFSVLLLTSTNYNIHGDRIASLSVKWTVLHEQKENDKKCLTLFFSRSTIPLIELMRTRNLFPLYSSEFCIQRSATVPCHVCAHRQYLSSWLIHGNERI